MSPLFNYGCCAMLSLKRRIPFHVLRIAANFCETSPVKIKICYYIIGTKEYLLLNRAQAGLQTPSLAGLSTTCHINYIVLRLIITAQCEKE
jgi:hypothetical protein